MADMVPGSGKRETTAELGPAPSLAFGFRSVLTLQNANVSERADSRRPNSSGYPSTARSRSQVGGQGPTDQRNKDKRFNTQVRTDEMQTRVPGPPQFKRLRIRDTRCVIRSDREPMKREQRDVKRRFDPILCPVSCVPLFISDQKKNLSVPTMFRSGSRSPSANGSTRNS
jgi:hypothetical protein